MTRRALPIRPVQDEQTVLSLRHDPLTIDSGFFAPIQRTQIEEQSVYSKDPRDWYLTEMEIMNHEGDGMPNPEIVGSPREYPVTLTFEVAKSNTSTVQFTVATLTDLGRKAISTFINSPWLSDS